MIFVLISAILVGGGIAFFFFKSLIIKDDDNLDFGIASAFQIGAFSNYDNAFRVAERNNGIVVTDDDIYRVYVAVLNNSEAIDKLSNYYENIGLRYYLKEITVSNSFKENIEDCEKLLISSNSDTYTTITKNVLKEYEDSL